MTRHTVVAGGSALLCVIALLTFPQATRVERAPGVVDGLPAWLVGHWEGSGFGGLVEETWTPARHGAMLGTFRLSVGGTARLYEFMLLSVADGQPTMRVKHFNADATAWEDRDEWITFRFERSTDRSLVFEGLVYELLEDAELRVAVEVGHADGQSEVAELRLRRVS